MDLSQYLEQGEFDSQGRFTMDPARARELLRDYALPNPRHYVLNLVCFLIGMGACVVHLRAQAGHLEIRGEGVVLPRELLANPLEGLFSGRDQPALRELALGLNAALGVAGTVRLRSGGHEGRYSKEFALGEFAGEETVFTVECRPGGELEALAGVFIECPVEVWSQGRRVSASLAAPDSCFVLELGGGLSGGEHPARHQLAHSAPLQASLWLGDLPETCRWIYLGRGYEMPLPFHLEGLGMQMWIACAELDRDLSLQSIVENERYERICAYLQAQLRRGLDEALELFLGGWRPAQMRPVALWALERAAAANQPALALELQQALGVHNRLDQLRLDLLQRRSAPEFEGSPEEIWEAARAHLAIKGARHHTTSRLLFRAGEHAYLRADFARAARCFGPYLSADPVRSEEVRAQYGHCLLRQGQLQEARHHLNRAVRAGGEQSWVLRAMEDLATVDAALGCPKEASQTLLQVLSRRQALVGSRSPELGLVLGKLVALSASLGDAKAVAQYQKWADSLDSY
ncbi:MAG: tetratricopeptide repeat protein [Candidatus Eremiobacteraeota bacterium]|nr:tetratricopeptide repeat protein [Candidatus Eremiobacteraeota bacterium]MCW5872187.1 tetratricopeptide repeat protein [Candidatus Eremiobacteraeota bacterium]